MSERYFFGEWVEANRAMTVEDIVKLCRQGERARRRLAEYPEDKIMSLLARVRDLWLSPQYPRRQKLEKDLPAETGFSSAMIDLAFQELAWTFDPKILRKKADKELQSDYDGSPKKYPLGVVLHVLSGNVFLVGAGSLVEGLLTKNVTILKMSSGEKLFLPELIRSVIECDEDGVVSGAVALVDYSSSQKDIIAELKKRVDGIVVWGGEDAVKAYRNDLPARTRLIMFGPKLSIGVVTKSGIAQQGNSKVASLLAGEIAIWDQNACTAPQVIFVEGEPEACNLVEALAVELERKNLEIPPGEADTNTAVEIGKVRSVFEIAEARGTGLLRRSKQNVDWTVVLDRDRSIDPSPLHRTIRVVPITKVEEIYPELDRLRGYIQTVGLAASVAEGLEISHELGLHGALRVLEIGQMAGGEIDDPHDGMYDLPQLVNLVISRPSKDVKPGHWVDYLSPVRRRELVNAHLRVLIEAARKAPFYAERLKGKRLETVEDLRLVPSLTREEMEANMPPHGNGLSTGSYHGGYVSRSGGSTGEPKFSVYDARDWEVSIAEAVRIFQSAGLEKGDRLANCMLAGDLYGSFVSFDHINYRVGVTSFAFAGSVNPEIFVDVWRKFRINVVQGIPTVIVPLLRAAKKLEPTFQLEKVMYAGIPLSGSDAAWIREVLGTKRISSIIGANDGNQLAYQCAEMKGAIHHLIDDYNYVEIVDEKGRPVPEGEAGKILVTSLKKFAFPLIRYEIGDSGRIVSGACACGRTSRVLEYLGRSDDSVCIGNMNLRFRDFASALSTLPISAIQLAARNSEEGEYLALRVESDEREGLKERILGTVLTRVGKIEERLNDKSLIKIDVDVVAPGALPRNPRTGKIKQLLDERS